jgi:hypothetical protein
MTIELFLYFHGGGTYFANSGIIIQAKNVPTAEIPPAH